MKIRMSISLFVHILYITTSFFCTRLKKLCIILTGRYLRMALFASEWSPQFKTINIYSQKPHAKESRVQRVIRLACARVSPSKYFIFIELVWEWLALLFIVRVSWDSWMDIQYLVYTHTARVDRVHPKLTEWVRWTIVISGDGHSWVNCN